MATLVPKHAYRQVDYPEIEESEKQLFGLLREVVQKSKLNVVMRVAGGWVRDKLLCLKTHDIDIALDTMLGMEFAEKVHDHLSRSGLSSHVPHKIKSNPAQSKHLETATVNLLGNDVDFVNLRTESYNDSRIPTICFGTAREDAFRRDFTINSMFYNINDDKIEDFTEMGHADLYAGIIRTPLDPLVTLSDDPLRSLRALRFAARLGFHLADDLAAAIPHPDVLRHFNQKVSRERMGIELSGILKDGVKALSRRSVRKNGASPVQGIFFLSKLSMYPCVFSIPSAYSLQDFAAVDPFDAVNITRVVCSYVQEQVYPFNHLRVAAVGMQTPATAGPASAESNDYEARCLILASYLAPFRDKFVVNAKKRTFPLVEVVIKESIKFPNKDATTVFELLESAKLLSHCVNGEQEWTRSRVGMVLRQSGALWHSALLLACAFDTVQVAPQIDFNTVELTDWQQRLCLEHPDHLGADCAVVRTRYTAFYEFVMQQQLEYVWSEKPLLNGREITELSGKRITGSKIADMSERLWEWQLSLRQPTREQAVEFMMGAIEEKLRTQS
eukprot:TRINITY_DN1130_c0_g1_i1.p1 TRINITY_DN1130_c0_g1~~TRINITY_DN1130_c0_g1_i1.p1  ORF type:complete len:583 (+),score=90.35 TRINITY_DN1130_c0_g1_i1:80-1750(+)